MVKLDKIISCCTIFNQIQNDSIQDADCVAKVKQLYKDLQLPEKFKGWKERNQREVKLQINQLLQSDETLRNACLNFFNYAYHN